MQSVAHRLHTRTWKANCTLYFYDSRMDHHRPGDSPPRRLYSRQHEPPADRRRSRSPRPSSWWPQGWRPCAVRARGERALGGGRRSGSTSAPTKADPRPAIRPTTSGAGSTWSTQPPIPSTGADRRGPHRLIAILVRADTALYSRSCRSPPSSAAVTGGERRHRSRSPRAEDLERGYSRPPPASSSSAVRWESCRGPVGLRSPSHVPTIFADQPHQAVCVGQSAAKGSAKAVDRRRRRSASPGTPDKLKSPDSCSRVLKLPSEVRTQRVKFLRQVD